MASRSAREVAYETIRSRIITMDLKPGDELNARALAQELAPEGIAVNCVAPGIIDTRMNACFDRAELEAEVPMGRLGTPREVAEAVLYLAESPYVTGQVLGVNGGIV